MANTATHLSIARSYLGSGITTNVDTMDWYVDNMIQRIGLGSFWVCCMACACTDPVAWFESLHSTELASINPIGIDPSGGGDDDDDDDPASASNVITGPTISTAPPFSTVVVAAAAVVVVINAVVVAASSVQKLTLSDMSQLLFVKEDSDEVCDSISHFPFEARCMKATHSTPVL